MLHGLAELSQRRYRVSFHARLRPDFRIRLRYGLTSVLCWSVYIQSMAHLPCEPFLATGSLIP